jgi:parvulin-like peptidyl-prolyl isomerase
MWFPAKFVLMSGIAFSLLQSANATPKEQNFSPMKSKPSPVSQAATKPREAAGPGPNVGANQPAITVHGVCEEGERKAAKDSSSCSKVITQEQFDNLVQALNPDAQAIPANARKNLAKTYAEYLAVEAAARKAGMEDTPQFRELMNWTRLRAITELYRRNLQEKYNTSLQEEIDVYYQQHLAEFERVRLVRILVPRENPSAPNKDEFDKKAQEAANAAREHLVQGLNPAQIQKDTYTALDLAAPPATDLGNRRRTDLIPEEAAEVFSLKPGEVSQVETEPKNYLIYKVESKDATPKEQVKNDISREIYQKKFRDAMKSVIDAAPAELNEQYFGVGVPSATPAKGPVAPPTSPAH